MKVLVGIYSPFLAWRIPEPQVAWLRGEFPDHTFTRADSDEALLAGIPDAEVAFSSLVTREQFVAARRLRWIHSPAAGIGSMLFPESVDSPVVITNSRGNSAATIAEHVIAVTLALFRQLPVALRRQAERTWAQNELSEPGTIRTLGGAHVLVVGLGAIGTEVARLALAFGARVTGVRRRPDAGPPAGIDAVVTPDGLLAALRHADAVVIAAPQTPDTWHLIGSTQLDAMKDGAILVNVSRGKLIDEEALARALASGRLGGAALDVFEHEPLAATSPLWSDPRVLVTPHVSGIHERYWPDATALFADNFRRFLAGQPLRNVVDKRAGY